MGDEARTTTAAPRSHALAHVEALQRDGLLLLAHLAEAPNGRLNGGVADSKDAVDPDLFITDPDVLANHPAKLGQLLKAVDLLVRDMEMCWPPTGPAPEKTDYFLVPLKPTAQDACTLLSQQKLREQIVFSRLEAWTCITYHFLASILSRLAHAIAT